MMPGTLKKMKPYAAMVLLQFGFACSNIIATATLKHGMNHFALVVYRNAVAAAVFAPLAHCFERKTRPKLTLPIFLKIVGLAIMEPVIDQNFGYIGNKLTSASFTSSFYNILPAVTFILALALRMETLKLRQRRGQAKAIGAAVTVVGAVLMIEYRGPAASFVWSKGRAHQGNKVVDHGDGDGADLLKGTLMLFISTLGWSSFLILQSKVLESYPVELLLSVWICSMGVVLNAIIALLVEHGTLQPWAVKWDMRLLTAIYTGIICSGVSYYLQGMVVKERGPVFVTAFNPLSMIFTSFMGSILLAEEITLGRILGTITIMVGVYSLIWGKTNEHQTCSNITGTTYRREAELPVVAPEVVRPDLALDQTFIGSPVTKNP